LAGLAKDLGLIELRCSGIHHVVRLSVFYCGITLQVCNHLLHGEMLCIKNEMFEILERAAEMFHGHNTDSLIQRGHLVHGANRAVAVFNDYFPVLISWTKNIIDFHHRNFGQCNAARQKRNSRQSREDASLDHFPPIPEPPLKPSTLMDFSFVRDEP
jgi:hypothetical protein